MIEYPDCKNCKTHDLLYGRKDSDAVLRIAMAVLVDRAKHMSSMILDRAEEYPTKKDIEEVFAHLSQDAIDVVDEVMHALKEAVTARLKELTVSTRVSQLNYDKDGKLEDIKVDIITK